MNKGLIGLVAIATAALVVAIVTGVQAGHARDAAVLGDPATLSHAADLAAASNMWLLVCAVAVIAALAAVAIRD